VCSSDLQNPKTPKFENINNNKINLKFKIKYNILQLKLKFKIYNIILIYIY
jgi:hypothetical protein